LNNIFAVSFKPVRASQNSSLIDRTTCVATTAIVRRLCYTKILPTLAVFTLTHNFTVVSTANRLPRTLKISFHNDRVANRDTLFLAMVATLVRQHLHDSTGEMVTVVVPQKIFRNRRRLPGAGRHAYFWTPVIADKCNCVHLQHNRRYMLACREDNGKSRLLLESDCSIANWHTE